MVFEDKRFSSGDVGDMVSQSFRGPIEVFCLLPCKASTFNSEFCALCKE